MTDISNYLVILCDTILRTCAVWIKLSTVKYINYGANYVKEECICVANNKRYSGEKHPWKNVSNCQNVFFFFIVRMKKIKISLNCMPDFEITENNNYNLWFPLSRQKPKAFSEHTSTDFCKSRPNKINYWSLVQVLVKVSTPRFSPSSGPICSPSSIVKSQKNHSIHCKLSSIFAPQHAN